VFKASSIIAANGDKIPIERYAILHDTKQALDTVSCIITATIPLTGNPQTFIGQILEITTLDSGPHSIASYIVVKPLHFLPDLHTQLHLPQLRLADDELLLLPSVRLA